MIIKQRLTNKGYCGKCKRELPLTSKFCPYCAKEIKGFVIEECMEIKHLRNELNTKR